jgi:small redox-active disulfide protein 2
MKTIRIFGPGCTACVRTLEIVCEAVAHAGIVVRTERITDAEEISGHGVASTPALDIDGDMKCAGRVPEKSEVLMWLAA